MELSKSQKLTNFGEPLLNPNSQKVGHSFGVAKDQNFALSILLHTVLKRVLENFVLGRPVQQVKLLGDLFRSSADLANSDESIVIAKYFL